MWGEEQVVPGSPSTPIPPCHTVGNHPGACGGPQHLTKELHGKPEKLKPEESKESPGRLASTANTEVAEEATS